MTARVYHAELWGKRDDKYAWLLEHTVEDTDWAQLDPAKPFYLFRPYDADAGAAYREWPAINKVMPVNSVGVVTSRDSFVIDFERDVLRERMSDFVSPRHTEADVRSRYLRDTDKLDVRRVRQEITEKVNVDQFLATICYRPFDSRFIFYHDAVIERSRQEVMKHLLAGENVGLTVCRQVISDAWRHVLATKWITDDSMVSNRTRERGYVCPLYLYPDVGKVDEAMFQHWPEGKNGRRPNLDSGFVNDLAERIGLKFISDGRGDLSNSFGPEDVLHYIYAVFHCPTYRRRYAEFLKLDFPRVPLTSDTELFVRLCKLGAELVGLHLLESEALSGASIGYPAAGSNTVDKGYPKYVSAGAGIVKAGKARLESDKRCGRVYINPRQFFEGIEPEVWSFEIGGYQVTEKWLKDRRERTLRHDDISRFTKIIEALRGTIRLMDEIDKAIPQWPMR